MYNTQFYSFVFLFQTFLEWVRNFQGQTYGMSSWEKWTFPTPSSLRVQWRIQSSRGPPKHLWRLKRRLYCWKNRPKIVCALQAWQFWHGWHSALEAESGGIWRGVSIMNCLRGTWPSVLNAIVKNVAAWRKESSKNTRVEDMEWFFIMRTPDNTRQIWLDWEILPHPHYSPDLAPSDYQSTALSPTIWEEFPSTMTLSSKIGSRLHGQTGGFLQAWDQKPARTLKGSSE
jgi:hypothetical protein